MEEIPEGKIIPSDAYRYWPTSEHIQIGSQKSLVRFIFYKVEFTEFEYAQLHNFKNYIKTQNPNLALPLFYSDEELLRIILGCKFDMKKAYSALISAIQWRSTNLTNSFYTILPFCKDLLNSGCIYFHGRDHRFRPLLIINVENFNLKQHSVDSYCYLLCFLLEFAIQKLMIPGQIENWIVLTDLNSKGLSKLPISEMKSIIKTLQDNFRCRMIVNYVVNAPTSLRFMWGMIKNFIEEHTIKKIRILKEAEPSEMRTHFAKNQYEKKYGGSAPNLSEFWPPCFPAGPFEVEGDSPEKYLTNISTYDVYNPVLQHEVTSEIDSVSERIDVKLPQSNICDLSELDSEFYDNLTSLGRNKSTEDRIDEADDSDQADKATNEVVVSPDLVVDRTSENINFFLADDINQDDVEVEINEPRGSVTPMKFNEIQPETKTSKFCRFCSNRKCEIF